MTESSAAGAPEEPEAQVADDRAGSAGMAEPSGVDEEGPPAQIPDDRRGAADAATHREDAAARRETEDPEDG